MQYIKEVHWAFKVPHLTTSILHEHHKNFWECIPLNYFVDTFEDLLKTLLEAKGPRQIT
jgi:hypothetical protein